MATQPLTVGEEPPSTCPMCGQQLINESAIEHVLRKQRENEAAQQRLERAIRQKAEADAQAKARQEIDRKIRAAKEAEAKKAAKLADALEDLKAQLFDLKTERKELERQHRAEIAALKQASEAARKKELRDALRKQKEALRPQVAREERGKVERELRLIDGARRGLEEENERLKRQLERMTAADRGEFNEEEVLQRLRLTFREDDIERSKRGVRGTDIFHRVRVGGSDAGLIIYECKDTLRWNNDFYAQCKRAGKTHGTSYVVLVSRAFPRNQKDLLTNDGVVVVHPSLLLHVAHIMRSMVAEIHRAGLTAQGQAQKTEELYRYLGGEDFRRTFGSLSIAARNLKDLLDKERDTHQRTWSRRETWYTEIGSVHSAIDERIRGIIEAPTRARGRKVIPLDTASIAPA